MSRNETIKRQESVDSTQDEIDPCPRASPPERGGYGEEKKEQGWFGIELPHINPSFPQCIVDIAHVYAFIGNVP